MIKTDMCSRRDIRRQMNAAALITSVESPVAVHSTKLQGVSLGIGRPISRPPIDLLQPTWRAWEYGTSRPPFRRRLDDPPYGGRSGVLADWRRRDGAHAHHDKADKRPGGRRDSKLRPVNAPEIRDRARRDGDRQPYAKGAQAL